jgi:hypothetical protein
MKKVMAFLQMVVGLVIGCLILLVFLFVVTVSAASKVVLNQSTVIRWSPAHYDTMWIDGVKTAVYVPSGRDTSYPATSYRRYYAINDTTIGADTSYKFFLHIYRKKGAAEILYDTVKFNGLQNGSWIILNADCTN